METTENAPAAPASTRAVQRLLLLCMGIASAGFIVPAAKSHQGLFFNGFLAVFALLFTLPYSLSLGRLLSAQPEAGLRLAAQAGGAMSVFAGSLALFFLVMAVYDPPDPRTNSAPYLFLLWWIALAICNMTLSRRARALLSTHNPSQGRGWKLGRGTAGVAAFFAFVLIVLAIQLPCLVRSPITMNETSAVGSLRWLQSASEQYRKSYGNGFPALLAELGPATGEPNCRAADLIDALLASGEKRGYRFNYIPGPLTGKPVSGCSQGTSGFAIVARPVIYGETGIRSFYVDESGKIRMTIEDRAATSTDALLN